MSIIFIFVFFWKDAMHAMDIKVTTKDEQNLKMFKLNCRQTIYVLCVNKQQWEMWALPVTRCRSDAVNRVQLSTE